MNPQIIIGIGFIVGALVESIFGFGSTIIAYLIIGLFIDFKTAIWLGVLIATLTSAFVFLTGIKNLSKKDLFYILLPAIPGLIIGSFLLDYVNSEILLKIFGILIISFTLYDFLKPKIPKFLERFLLLINGFIHGFIGTGGPIPVTIMKNKMDKSALRTTFALYFVILDVMRIVQYYLQNTFNFSETFQYWWLVIAILIVVILGHKIHLNISTKLFKQGISVILLIAGIYFIFK